MNSKDVIHNEYLEYKQQESAYNRTHNEMINMSEYIRKASMYIQEKENEKNRESSRTHFPSFRQSQEVRTEQK